MKTYLKLNGDCFLWYNASEGLLYNSNNGKMHLFNQKQLIHELCMQFTDLLNLYCVEVTKEKNENPIFGQWLANIQSKEMGELLVMEDESGIKPVSMLPLLSILMDVNRLRNFGEEYIYQELFTYLHEVSIQLSGQNSGYLSEIHKQIYTPKNSKEILTYEDFRKIISQVLNLRLERINIIGDSIFKYTDLPKIISLLNDLNTANTFIVNSQAVISASRSLNVLKDKNIELQVVCGPLDDLSEIENILIENSLKYSLSITVASEEEYDIADKKASNLKSGNYEIKPVYNGKNLEFFKEYVFFTEEDIADRKLCKREVFANQALNTNFFGKLTIMPDGETYANVNHPSLGNIFNDSIYEILYKEMDEGTSWRMTRDKEEPCKDCLYKYLCPSPSDYELVIGKMNLCHINQV